MNFRLAWRNIWRNKRRTIITMAAIFLAVFMANIMRAFQLGTYKKMISNTVNTYTGYLQIHKKGYWEDKTIENSLVVNESFKKLISKNSSIAGIIPRLESFALASGKTQARGVMVVGIDPAEEARCTRLDSRVTNGIYLSEQSNGVMIAEKCASYLSLQVGDSLVLIGQGYHGVSVAGIYPVLGLVHFPSPQLNTQLVFMSLMQCQGFYGADSAATTVVCRLKKTDDLEDVYAGLKSQIAPEQLEVMKWSQIVPEIVQQIQTDNIGGQIMLGILYLIVGFGIFGTIVMMTNERIREFGVVTALGMSKFRLSIIVFVETILLSLVAIIVGAIAAFPVVLYFSVYPLRFTGEAAQAIIAMGIEPVMPTVVDCSIFCHQALIVGVLTLVSVSFPLLTIAKLKSIEAIRR